MALTIRILTAALLVALAVPAWASSLGVISTDRFGYSGTVTRYATLADAQSGANAIGSYAIGNRDLSLYIVNGMPSFGADYNIIMGSWWYTTDSLGRAGYGNTTGNSGQGFVQIYDSDASTDISQSFAFGNFDGTFFTTFAMSLTGENADYPSDYARFWVDYQGGGADKVIYHSYALNLTAGGLEGVMNGGVIEAFDQPESVNGTYAGIFENVSTTYPQNNGFYAFDLSLSMVNWAWTNRDSLTGEYPFADSYFAATVPAPEPGSMLLLGSGLLGAAFMRRRKAKAS